MKKIVLSLVVCTALAGTLFARGGYGHGASASQSATPVGTYATTVTSTAATVTDVQKEDLLYMYEEEKVARDVYRTLGDMWGASIFYNIANAEQRHMDAIANLLVQYDIPVPALSSETGLFQNTSLQALYDQLIEEGSISLEEAFHVGVLVEETDIVDLQARMVDIPSDIAAVYTSLLNGSYNHLNAFNRVLDQDSVATGSRGRRGR